MYFVVFLFGFGINLILLFNQMHCTIQKRERERERERERNICSCRASHNDNLILDFVCSFKNVAQSFDTLERPSHCNRKLRTWPEI